ncbi:magnesium transporter MgtE N-terminal domain-containing protein [Bacillus rubiinfantis]|uniref:magnesium transporter MgtE N-terminal domain-containing protein n=1 Tax=Bacillus rubiinfantis TaxID=1499680 RepID=UPI0005A9B6FA|nr:hypothetical protein [Bacillus rubiinfantis]
MEEEKEHGKLRSLLLFGVFPILTLLILGLFIFNWLGFPVWKTAQAWANDIPVIGSIIPDPASTPADKQSSESSADDSAEIEKTKAKLKTANEKLTAANMELKSTKQQLEDLKKSNEQLQFQLENNSEQTNKDQSKNIAAIYENMSSSKAAAIMESMSIEDAAITISTLNKDVQSEILGKMKDAKKAGQITLLLKEIANLNVTDTALLKQQLESIRKNGQDPIETLSDTIAAMPAAQAAVLVQSMMKSNSQTAINLMKSMNTSSRSQILTEISNKDADLAAQITVSLEK